VLTLSQYLDGMRRARTTTALEAAIQAPFKHEYQGRVWSQIRRVIVDCGLAICDKHDHGRFVPRLGARHRLTVCGEEYKVGYGQNSTGVRYCWTAAEEFAMDVLTRNGLSRRAANSVWEWSLKYPHRALEAVEAGLAGKLPDPRFNRLLGGRDLTGSPVRVNRRTEAKTRAHRPCKCGKGWLWDWGCGWNGYANFINWHCDRCPRVYTEYVTNERLYQIRAMA
jgi:hypothetical protein